MWLADEQATAELGHRLGELANAGTVIALIGDLGMGKSVLARGVARGLGLTERIPSPTFVILSSYLSGRLPFHHADLYRLGDPDELFQLGLDDVMGVEGVCVVEWADRFPGALPGDHLTITLTEEGRGRRALLQSGGSSSRALELGLG